MYFLPRGSKGSGASFRATIEKIAAKRKKQFFETLFDEAQRLLYDIVDNTPIDTGASAGVTENSVGSKRRAVYKGHPAYGLTIGNRQGESGWQINVSLTTTKIDVSITNPMWNEYLKYYETGVLTPLPPAHIRFAYRAFVEHQIRLKGELRAS